MLQVTVTCHAFDFNLNKNEIVEKKNIFNHTILFIEFFFFSPKI